jgi:hypothetical protein
VLVRFGGFGVVPRRHGFQAVALSVPARVDPCIGVLVSRVDPFAVLQQPPA